MASTHTCLPIQFTYFIKLEKPWYNALVAFNDEVYSPLRQYGQFSDIQTPAVQTSRLSACFFPGRNVFITELKILSSDADDAGIDRTTTWENSVACNHGIYSSYIGFHACNIQQSRRSLSYCSDVRLRYSISSCFKVEERSLWLVWFDDYPWKSKSSTCNLRWRTIAIVIIFHQIAVKCSRILMKFHKPWEDWDNSEHPAIKTQTF